MEKTTKQKLEKSKELKERYEYNYKIFNSGNLSSPTYCENERNIQQQAKELLEAKVIGCGITFYSCDEFCLCDCKNNCLCPTCQEENNQANKICKEIIG